MWHNYQFVHISHCVKATIDIFSSIALVWSGERTIEG